jgi:hypothetical protein
MHACYVSVDPTMATGSSECSDGSTSRMRLLNGYEMVGMAGLVSLAVLGMVGRRSYQRKIVQLTKEMEKEASGRAIDQPPRVWAVLTPMETIKVFLVPMGFVGAGCGIIGYGLKQWYGVRDIPHGFELLRWITRTGPPPSH